MPGQKQPPTADDVERPDVEFLHKLEVISGGKMYMAEPQNIRKALADINSFFGSRVYASK
jgi:hypothetical protein